MCEKSKAICVAVLLNWGTLGSSGMDSLISSKRMSALKRCIASSMARSLGVFALNCFKMGMATLLASWIISCLWGLRFVKKACKEGGCVCPYKACILSMGFANRGRKSKPIQSKKGIDCLKISSFLIQGKQNLSFYHTNNRISTEYYHQCGFYSISMRILLHVSQKFPTAKSLPQGLENKKSLKG